MLTADWRPEAGSCQGGMEVVAPCVGGRGEETGGDTGDGFPRPLRAGATNKEGTRERTVFPRSKDQSSSESVLFLRTLIPAHPSSQAHLGPISVPRWTHNPTTPSFLTAGTSILADIISSLGHHGGRPILATPPLCFQSFPPHPTPPPVPLLSSMSWATSLPLFPLRPESNPSHGRLGLLCLLRPLLASALTSRPRATPLFSQSLEHGSSPPQVLSQTPFLQRGFPHPLPTPSPLPCDPPSSPG